MTLPNPIRSWLPARPTPTPRTDQRGNGARTTSGARESGERHRAEQRAREDPGERRRGSEGNGRRRTGARSGAKHWLLTSVVCQEPAYPMCYMGLAGGSAPSTPDGDPARRHAGSDPPPLRLLRHRSEEHERRSVPASGSARSPAAVNRFAVLRSAPAFGDCHGRPCGIALAGQPEGWPSSKTNKRRSCAAPLSR